MSETPISQNSGSPPRSWQDQTELLGLHGPFFNEKGSYAEFPTYDYQLDTDRFTDEGVISVTPESRLRHCLMRISETCGQDFQQFQTLSEPSLRKSQLHSSKVYLTSSVALYKSGPKVQRASIADHSLATNEVFEQWQKQNHPAWQVIQQLETSSQEIKPEVISGLKEDLAIVINWPKMRLNYERQVEAYKISSGLIALARYIIAN